MVLLWSVGCPQVICMRFLAVVLQMFFWIGGGIWITDFFEIQNVLQKVLVFGVTGITPPLFWFLGTVVYELASFKRTVTNYRIYEW